MKWNGCINLQYNLMDILFWNHLALLFSSVAAGCRCLHSGTSFGFFFYNVGLTRACDVIDGVLNGKYDRVRESRTLERYSFPPSVLVDVQLIWNRQDNRQKEKAPAFPRNYSADKVTMWVILTSPFIVTFICFTCVVFSCQTKLGVISLPGFIGVSKPDVAMRYFL